VHHPYSESLVFDQISSGKKQRILATHALQFLFLGFTGFRFPCAHFPSTTASGYELYLLLWVHYEKYFWIVITVNIFESASYRCQ
jgi:hypothetical protein